MRSIQLKIIAAFCLVGLILSGIWLWTGHKSWPGLMLERQVEKDRLVPEDALLKVWNQCIGLERTLLPGRHTHYSALAAQVLADGEKFDSGQVTAALVQGLESARHALAREPADAHAWARKAWMEYSLNGESLRVINALRMSVYCKPAGESLIFWRIYMSGLNREFWDSDFESLLRRQIIQAWNISPHRLVSTVEGVDMEDIARQVLHAYPEDLRKFEEFIAGIE